MEDAARCCVVHLFNVVCRGFPFEFNSHRQRVLGFLAVTGGLCNRNGFLHPRALFPTCGSVQEIANPP